MGKKDRNEKSLHSTSNILSEKMDPTIKSAVIPVNAVQNRQDTANLFL